MADTTKVELNRLIETGRSNAPLPAAAPASEITEGRGFSTPKKPAASTGGIAGPLTETAYADREYYDDAVFTTSDGIFTFIRKPPKQLQFVDGNNNALKIVLKEPT